MKNKSIKTSIFAGAVTCMLALPQSIEVSAAIAMVESQNYEIWNSKDEYTKGEKIVFNKKVYEAKWWTQGENPEDTTLNEWDSPWNYLCNSASEGISSRNDEGALKENVGEGIEWRENVFAPYVDATSWPPVSLSEASIQTGSKFFNLGFIVSKDKKASWGTYYEANECPLNEEIKKLRAMGGDIMVSFGGFCNTPLHLDIKETDALMKEYKRFIDMYNLTRVDFDIEGNALLDKEATQRNTDALLLLKEELKNEGKDIDITFTLPASQSGLNENGLYVIEDAVKKGLEFKAVNAMSMNFGSKSIEESKDKMGEYSINTLKSLYAQVKEIYSECNKSKSDEEVWAMLGITPMIGVNDTKNEVFTQKDAEKLANFAKEKNINYIGFWSINRDNGGSEGVCSDKHTGMKSKKYEFSKIINKIIMKDK